MNKWKKSLVPMEYYKKVGENIFLLIEYNTYTNTWFHSVTIPDKNVPVFVRYFEHEFPNDTKINKLKESATKWWNDRFYEKDLKKKQLYDKLGLL